MRRLFNLITTIALLFLFAITEPAIAAEPIPESQQKTYDRIATLRDEAFGATNQGKFGEAEVFWTELIELLPDNPALISNRGNSRVSQGKLESAIEDFNQAIVLSPESSDPYLNRGAAYEGLEKFEEAIADYNHVIELDPNDAAAYNNRGNARGGLRTPEHFGSVVREMRQKVTGFLF